MRVDIRGWRFVCRLLGGTSTPSLETERIFGRFNGKRGNTRTKRKVPIKAGVRTNDGA